MCYKNNMYRDACTKRYTAATIPITGNEKH